MASARKTRHCALESDREIEEQSDGSAGELNTKPATTSDYKFIEEKHPKEILDGLSSLRLEGRFCDVTLECAGQTFPCHRSVLVSLSSYFKAMFTGNLSESCEKHVEIRGVEPDMLKTILDYAYTASACITQGNVQGLMSTANMLGVLSLREACCSFMQVNMDINNCLGVHCFADALDCKELADKAKTFALAHFGEVCQSEEFLGLTHEKLVELLSSDDLNLDSEEQVFVAAKKWLEYTASDSKEQSDSRLARAHEVLAQVRLALLSPYFLHDCVEQISFVQNSTLCQKLVSDAKNYQLLKDRQAGCWTVSTRPRKSSGLIETIVAVGGEDDKVVLRSVESYDAEKQQWRTMACLPFAISKHGLAVDGHGLMYLAGGEYPDGSASRSVWRYEAGLDLWNELCSMNVPRSELGLAVLDGFVYAVGGWDGSDRLDSVERYNPMLNLWTYVAPMKMALTSPAVLSYQGFLYVTGGAVLEDGDGIEMVQCYNPRDDQWHLLPPMLIARSGSVACILKGNLYVIGGWHASTENTNKVERFIFSERRWESRGAMNEKRYRPGVAVINGKIHVCGGEEGWDRYHDTMEQYDEETDTWAIVGEMPTSRSWLSCVAMKMRREWISKSDKIQPCIV